ncbi:MAG: ribonuclease D [Gammaproteobacteria bacterium]|nr:ribonuclease D [Gammaproteobacteria bacterium]MDH5734538.1 ribonuclease D [Gammaproteobacteria bacterium]
MNYTFIETYEQLITSCEQLTNSRFICVDTEFHREKTYYPELALLQIANDSIAFCIDPLTIKDLQPVLELLSNPAITKVFHAAQQDIEIFFHHLNTMPSPVFDTQIAATLLGYGEQIGYADLIKDVLNIDVDKSQTRTDWMIRPLSEKQLDYAASDVIYLAAAYPVILDRLKKLKRFEWLEDDLKQLSRKEQYQVDINTIWKKVKGHQRLSGPQLAILQSIAAWREETAQQKNRPRRRILSDDALIDIARQKTSSSTAILALRSMNQARLSKEDAETLAIRVTAGLNMPKDTWPSIPKKQKLNFNDDALIDSLTAILKIMAHKHKINHTIMASRKQLEALVRGERDLPISTGWRKQHGGQMLLDFLDGKLSLHVESGVFKIQN